MDIKKNIQAFLNGRGQDERYASFDYCFNYFRSFSESQNVSTLANSENLQDSCLQLGFYLASWGMYRGKAALPKKSVKIFEPAVKLISQFEYDLWAIDVDNYDMKNMRHLVQFKKELVKALNIKQASMDTLVTKIMLGVYANTPAFDRYVRSAFGVTSFNLKSLIRISAFYDKNKTVIDTYQIPTIDFLTGADTRRLYSKAKIIDMIGFIGGQEK